MNDTPRPPGKNRRALTIPAVTVEIESERRADRDDPVADCEPTGVADAGRRQAGGVDLHECDVAANVQPDHMPLELATVDEDDACRFGVDHRVGAGQDVAIGGDHDA
jgi:hypothetical protein